MPKATFLHLSQEKRDEMLKKAEDLFAEFTYEIKLVDLLEGLGMAPGTFYRYFKDKDDLFLHMLEEGGIKSTNDNFILRPDFEEITEQNFDARLRKRNEMFHQAPEEVVRRFYFGVNKERLIPRFRKELQNLKYQGMLRDDADPELLAYMYATTLYNFEMYCRDYGITHDLDLIWKMKKYFYYSFFTHGILKDKKTPTRKNNADREDY